MRERVAIVLLVSIGAVFLPGALDRFVFPKLAVGAAATALVMTVRGRGRLPRSVCLGLVAASLLLAAAALSSTAPVAAILGRPPRYEGLIALPVYLGALLAGARLLGPTRAPGTSAWMLDVLSLVAVAVAVEGGLEAAGLRPLLSNVARPGSLLGNASDQGAWAVLALGPLSLAAIELREKLHIAGAVAAAAALATSGSRGALVGLIVVAITLVASRRGRATKVAIVCGVATIALGVLVLPATRGRVLETSPLAQHTTTGRLLLWAETLRLVSAHPVLGAGPSGFVDTIPAYHDRRYEREIGPQAPPDSPHDWVLQAASAGGAALALLAVGLAVLTLIRGRRLIAREPDTAEQVVLTGLLAGLAGYAVALLAHFTTAGTAPLGALYAGALLAERAGPRTYLAGRTIATAAYGGLTVVLAAAAIAEVPLRSGLVRAAAGDLAGANRSFRVARDLRPWDRGIDQIATHAYAVLAARGDTQAARLGLPWAATERRAYPRSVQALQDSATLDRALGRTGLATQLLRAAQRLEPQNPTL